MLVSTIWTHFSIDEDGVVTSKKKAKVAFDRQNMHKKRCLSQQILDGFKQSGASRNCNSLASVARHWPGDFNPETGIQIPECELRKDFRDQWTNKNQHRPIEIWHAQIKYNYIYI